MKQIIVGLTLVGILSLTGCMTQGGTREIPIPRDYKELVRLEVEEVEDVVAQAHRVGAGHFSPYEYESAANYLEIAQECKREVDRKG